MLGLLGLDMKVAIPPHGLGKPLTEAVITQLMDHIQDQLMKTSYSEDEFNTIKSSIANLASLGLLQLGLQGQDYGRKHEESENWGGGERKSNWR